MAVTVRIACLPHAVGLPFRASVGASGMDLMAAVEDEMALPAGERVLVPTGLVIALPRGFEAQVRARSGLAWRHGIVVLNGPGTVDADYRGEVKVILGNLGREPFVIRRGMRIAQMVIAAVPEVRVEPVEHVPESERDAGGFGSTGV